MSETVPTILKIYNEVNNVIGGTDPDEMFCMSMPGMVINPEEYAYDVRFEKPIKVAGNESRLVNKMYDPSEVVGGDNGHLLATQFKTALDSLTPKINSVLIAAKNELRDMLKMEMTYTLDDGQTIKMPFQQLYYKLYEEYVDEKNSWSNLQNQKKEELLIKYPDDSDEMRLKREEEFLTWYQIVAETNLLKINMKHGKVLALFSDNDMKIIEGVLDSGVGAELQEAREQVVNSRKYDPDGGYVYPVKLEPADWFNSLTSSFSFIDLLDSSEQLAQKYDTLRKKRNNIANQIALLEGSDQSSDIAQLVAQLDESQKAYDKAVSEMDQAYGDGFFTGVKMIVDIVKFAGKEIADIPQEDQDKAVNAAKEEAVKNQKPDVDQINFEKLKGQMDDIDAKQHAIDNAAIKVNDLAAQVILAKTSDYSKEIKTLYANLKDAEDEMESVKDKLNSAIQKEDGKLNDKLFPNSLESRYMEVSISANSAEMKQESHTQSHSKRKTTGVNFLFGGYHSSSDEASASAEEALDSNEFSLEIGFLATKVTITRNWFNPGVFLLSEDMYHTSKNKISLGDLHASDTASCLFPCYPTAMVIAKDVSIKIKTDESHMQSMKSMSESHASKGGGFLCFKTNKSSSDSSNDSSLVSTSSDNAIVIKIPGPQVLGFYLQSTPMDKSMPYAGDAGTQEMDKNIIDFVESYRKLLSSQV